MMTLEQASNTAGVDRCTIWHMIQEGVIPAPSRARYQYDPAQISEALPEFRWRRKYSGDTTPLFMVCGHCEVEKAIHCFRKCKSSTAKYGYHFKKQCRDCEAKKKKRPDVESHREYQREWRSRPSVQDRIREQRKKRDSSPQRQLERRLSKRMREALSHGWRGGKWRQALPYTIDDLRSHLEKQFLPGMGWHNMDEWHIDHIIPKSTFSYLSPKDDDFIACWSLANLRPLWARDNIAKGAKVETLI